MSLALLPLRRVLGTFLWLLLAGAAARDLQAGVTVKLAAETYLDVHR